MRRILLLAALGAAFVLWRRRRPPEHVDVAFDDGSLVRLDRGVEASDLLDDARQLLRTLSA